MRQAGSIILNLSGWKQPQTDIVHRIARDQAEKILHVHKGLRQGDGRVFPCRVSVAPVCKLRGVALHEGVAVFRLSNKVRKRTSTPLSL